MMLFHFTCIRCQFITYAYDVILLYEHMMVIHNMHIMMLPGRVGQLVGHLTRKSEVLGSISGPATYFRFSSADLRGAVVSYWRKYVHEVLVNCLGGLSLPRKSVVRLTDHPDMTLHVYRGRKTTTQQQQHSIMMLVHFMFMRCLFITYASDVSSLQCIIISVHYICI